MNESGRGLPGAAMVYVAAVYLCGIAVAAACVLGIGFGWPYREVGTIELVLAGALLSIAGFMGDLNPISRPSTRVWTDHQDELHLSSSVYIACLLLYGPALTVIVAVVSVTLAELCRRKPLYKIGFNAGQYAITVGISGTFMMVSGYGSAPFTSYVSTPEGVLALVAALSIYWVLNTGLVAAVVAMVQRVRLPDIWFQAAAKSLPEYVTMLNLGVLAAILWMVSPVALVLLILPMMMLYFASKTTSQLKNETVEALVAIAGMVDSRDSYTYRHSMEVARYSTLIATRLSLPLAEVQMVKLAAQLHDIGKIGTPDHVLQKPSALTDEEYTLMKAHPGAGADVLKHFSLFISGMDQVLYHQEHYDGSGYPKGLKGEEIPMGARIIHVADAYQAMTSDRVYRKALDPNVAVGRLMADAGKQFDPLIVKALIEALQAEKVPIHAAVMERLTELNTVPGRS